MSSTRTLLPAFLLCAVFSAAQADNTVFSSGEGRVTLVELYTSEGCSSCPRADRWLSSLEDEPGLWQDFVPVAFHVDYWDYLGWPDRFAAPEYGDRQRRYAEQAGLSIVYTPGMLRSGSEWRGWHRGEAPAEPPSPAGPLTLEISARSVAASFQPAIEPDGELLVHVALLGMDLSSEVSAGENRGRRLEHDFVVLSLTSAALSGRGDRLALELDLPTSGAQAIVAWVSTEGRQAPLQAVGGFLPRR